MKLRSRARLSVLALFACSLVAHAQGNYTETITVTNSPVNIVVNGNSAVSVIIRENAATPTAVFSITPAAAGSVAVNLAAGQEYKFSGAGRYNPGTVLGTIVATTAGPFTFVLLESPTEANRASKAGTGTGGAVASVFGRTGAVVAASGDYNLGLISPGVAGSGTYDFTGVTLLKARIAAGLTTTVNGDHGYDTTNFNWHGWNGADGIFPLVPVGTATNGQCPTWVVSSGKVSLGSAACGAAGANTALSNLNAVSINASLLAQTGVDLGGTSNPFRNLYLFGSGTYGSTYIQLTGTPTSTRTATFPDNTGTVPELNFAQTWSALQTFGSLTGTGAIDFSGSTISKFRVGAGLTTTANGDVGYDITNKNWHLWQNGADALAAIWSGALTTGHCTQISVSSGVTTLVDSGSSNCGGGGSTAWSAIGNPIGNLSLTMGSFTSIFNTTSGLAQFFAWKNTTPAVAGTSQGSPVLAFCGRDWTGSDVEGCGTLSYLAGNGVNAPRTITIGATGPSTGVVTTQFPGPVVSGSSGGGAGVFSCPEGTAPSGIASSDLFYCDSTAHRFKAIDNNGTATTPALFTDNLSVFASGGNIAPAQILATGIVDGQAPITITTGTTANLGTTYKSGYTFNQEATAATGVTYTLPATSAGSQYCVQNSGTTGVVNTGVLTVYPPASSFVILNGTVNTVGGGGTHGVASGGAAGDGACFVAIDSTHWEVFPLKGTWTAN